MRLFLTGNPGVGKTTLIRAIIEQLEEVTCAGFYTEEKRHRGKRTGFKIVTLDGREASLASLGGQKPTVGKYSVHVDEFEKLVLPELDTATLDSARKFNIFVLGFAFSDFPPGSDDQLLSFNRANRFLIRSI